jgi:hypothetical protein
LRTQRSWEGDDEPDTPRVVVRFFAESAHGLGMSSPDPVPINFSRVVNLTELRALDPVVAMARFLEARESTPEALASGNVRDFATTRRLVGAVARDATTQHVVYETRIVTRPGGRVRTIPSTLTLELRDSRWVLLPVGSFFNDIRTIPAAAMQ